MDFQLKVRFTGLCAFVPHDSQPKAKVLLIDGRTITASPLIHCAPVLRFNRADLAADSPRQADVCRDGFSLPCSIQDSVAFLDGEDLKIEALAGTITAPPFSFVTGLRAAGDAVPTEQSRDDASWMADLDQICPGAGAEQRWWFDPKPMPPSGGRSPILARFDLDRGTLRAVEFFRSSSGNNPSVFTFTSGYKQAIASFVECTIDCKDGTQLQISSRPWGGGAPRHLKFAPRGQELVLEISNAPIFDVMQEMLPGTNGWTFPPSTVFANGHSFMHFYRLQPTPPSGPLEVPCKDNSVDSGRMLTRMLAFDKGVGCSPAKTAKTSQF